jgi:uncharacterized protein (TIGR02453 family)
MASMTFKGFGPQALPFLKALGFHQTKAWFEENRAIYENEIKEPLGDLVEELSEALAAEKIPLRGDRKKAVFRLHRDTRFSKDKSPYKTNSGAVLNRHGTRGTGGMLYIHIAPEGCFAAAGWYMPEPAELAQFRAAIVKSPKAYFAMETALAKGKLKLSDDYTLKRTPKGYEGVTDPALLVAVKRTGFVVSRPLKETELGKPKLAGSIVAFARDALPLLQYGWKITG